MCSSDLSSQTVNVAAGASAEQNFNVGGAAAMAPGEVVKLDELIVSETRETNAAAIATNEQRYAPNMKSVVSSDAFGDANEGNVGEFLKYLPGVDLDYVESEPRGPRLGGMDGQYVGVAMDGMRTASADANRALKSVFSTTAMI